MPRPIRAADGPGSVAYVLMGFPRLSETYIHSEIHRVEQAGVRVRLYVINPADAEEEAHERGPRHPVLDLIQATPVHLPGMTSSAAPLLPWMRRNLRPFLAPLARTVTRRPLGTTRAALAAGAQTLRARPTRWSAPDKLYFKQFLRAVALADDLRRAPDVRHIHAHYAHGPTTVAWLAATITGLPFSFTGHARDIYAPERNPAGLLRRKLLAARFAVTCTQANVAHLRRIAPEATVHCIYHGLNADLERYAERAPAAPRRNGTLRLLGVGRLVEKKGFDTLVEACGQLKRTGVPFEARIIGPDGPHGPAIRERVRAHGLERSVRLLGPLGQHDLCGEYLRADAFCLPCRVLDQDRDGIPNVLVEAMACGTPVVTTGVSGIPELVADGVNGLIVPPDDAGALAEAVRRLHHDRELGARMGAAGRATVRERFDGERLARRLAGLFAQAVASAEGRR
jgi:glycosyltransferase involved in cell wall biosynthesis